MCQVPIHIGDKLGSLMNQVYLDFKGASANRVSVRIEKKSSLSWSFTSSACYFSVSKKKLPLAYVCMYPRQGPKNCLKLPTNQFFTAIFQTRLFSGEIYEKHLRLNDPSLFMTAFLTSGSNVAFGLIFSKVMRAVSVIFFKQIG